MKLTKRAAFIEPSSGPPVTVIAPAVVLLKLTLARVEFSDEPAPMATVRAPALLWRLRLPVVAVNAPLLVMLGVFKFTVVPETVNPVALEILEEVPLVALIVPTDVNLSLKAMLPPDAWSVALLTSRAFEKVMPVAPEVRVRAPMVVAAPVVEIAPLVVTVKF